MPAASVRRPSANGSASTGPIATVGVPCLLARAGRPLRGDARRDGVRTAPASVVSSDTPARAVATASRREICHVPLRAWSASTAGAMTTRAART